MEGEDKKVGCTGRCENCTVNQRTYCASQMAYYAQKEVAEIKAILLAFMQKKDEDNIVVLLDEERPIEDENDSNDE